MMYFSLKSTTLASRGIGKSAFAPTLRMTPPFASMIASGIVFPSDAMTIRRHLKKRWLDRGSSASAYPARAEIVLITRSVATNADRTDIGIDSSIELVRVPVCGRLNDNGENQTG